MRGTCAPRRRLESDPAFHPLLGDYPRKVADERVMQAETHAYTSQECQRHIIARKIQGLEEWKE